MHFCIVTDICPRTKEPQVEACGVRVDAIAKKRQVAQNRPRLPNGRDIWHLLREISPQLLKNFKLALIWKRAR